MCSDYAYRFCILTVVLDIMIVDHNFSYFSCLVVRVL